MASPETHQATQQAAAIEAQFNLLQKTNVKISKELFTQYVNSQVTAQEVRQAGVNAEQMDVLNSYVSAARRGQTSKEDSRLA